MPGPSRLVNQRSTELSCMLALVIAKETGHQQPRIVQQMDLVALIETFVDMIITPTDLTVLLSRFEFRTVCAQLNKHVRIQFTELASED